MHIFSFLKSKQTTKTIKYARGCRWPTNTGIFAISFFTKSWLPQPRFLQPLFTSSKPQIPTDWPVVEQILQRFWSRQYGLYILVTERQRVTRRLQHLLQSNYIVQQRVQIVIIFGMLLDTDRRMRRCQQIKQEHLSPCSTDWASRAVPCSAETLHIWNTIQKSAT